MARYRDARGLFVQRGERKPEEATTTKDGKPSFKRTSKGWFLCVLWNDGSTTWESLRELKETHMLQVAEYAVAKGLVEEPAFKWWVPKVLKKRDRIIKAMKKWYFR